MLQNKHESARKNYLVIVSCIVTCLTLVSFVASYTVYLESFKDWGGIGRVFAAMVAVGVEVAFAVLIYGMAKALIGGEIPVAGFGAASLLIVMAVNFAIHSRQVRHVPLASWQEDWLNWVGLMVPFYTIALFVLLSWLTPEAKERRQERRMTFIAKQRALDHKQAYLESPELDAELDNLGPMIAEEVKRHITRTLPAASRPIAAESKPQIGFPTNPQNQAGPVDFVRNRYFPNSDTDRD